MKTLLIILIAAALTSVACAASSNKSTAPAAAKAKATSCELLSLPPATQARQQVLWGHIKSLEPKGSEFELRFDPALMLNGATADRAAAEDGREVTNDYYIVDETHRLLSYVVESKAPVTILTQGRCMTAQISAAELAQILKGENPNGRKLFGDTKSFGFWIRVDYRYPNPVISLDQQYQP
jgi:hypothetical protein